MSLRRNRHPDGKALQADRRHETRQEARALLAAKRALREAERAARAIQAAKRREARRREHEDQRYLDRLHADTSPPGEPQEQAARRARGLAGLSMAFWPILGRQPVCAPADTETATVYHRRILRVLEEAGWTKSERAALLKMEKVWGQRARGEERRFMVAGNRRGRLPESLEAQVRAGKQEDKQS
jgi:hypothetical protein